ncbi:MAG: hypothetical protein SAL70_24555 [Scytonema sp. PMC 1070.18]|nr:hypothetical protein [Scytonema sp. PMC 1070.18]
MTEATDKTSCRTTNKAKKTPKDTFDIDAFINALDSEFQVKFVELLNTESSLTNAVIGIVNAAKQKMNSDIRTTKKVSVRDEVEEIVNAIMIYNEAQNIATNRVVLAYALINKISERYLNKTIAKLTYDKYIDDNSERLHRNLEALEIPGGLYNSKWNGQHHRKTMDTVIESVITILNQSPNNS